MTFLLIITLIGSTSVVIFSTKNSAISLGKSTFNFIKQKKILINFKPLQPNHFWDFFTNVCRSRNQSATFWLFYHTTNNFRWIKKIENCSKDFKEKLIFLVLLAWLANWKYDWIECLLASRYEVCMFHYLIKSITSVTL